MSHTHEHTHEHSHDHSTYYMEQLCTIGVCGVLGLVAVLLYFQRTADNQRMLDFILARYLHPYVLGCGVALLGVTALRGIFLWFSVGRLKAAHSHNHNHAEDGLHDEHDHDHEEHIACHIDHEACAHDHGHDHGHEHHWNPWRYIVLCLPIMLFFLGLPNEGFRSVKATEIEESADHTVKEQKGDVLHLNFKELDSSTYSEDKREYFEGRTGVLKGQFLPKSPTAFGLVRFKITCCAADAIPLNVVILSPEPVDDIKNLSWVQVTGQIQYRKKKNREEYVPVIKMRSRNDIVQIPPDEDPYLQ